MSWKGSFYLTRVYTTLKREIMDLMVGPPNSPPAITADHIDDLKTATAPKTLSFVSKGAAQKVPHELGAIPRAVAISSFKAPRSDGGHVAPTEIVVGAVTDTDITVTSVAGTEITLLLYPPYRFPA